MSITETRPETAPAASPDTPEPETARGLAGWLSTSDHKRIGRSLIVTSLLFLLAALVLGAVFLGLAVQLLREATPARAMRLFVWSITYVTLLFGAMAADQLVRSGL